MRRNKLAIGGLAGLLAVGSGCGYIGKVVSIVGVVTGSKVVSVLGTTVSAAEGMAELADKSRTNGRVLGNEQPRITLFSLNRWNDRNKNFLLDNGELEGMGKKNFKVDESKSVGIRTLDLVGNDLRCEVYGPEGLVGRWNFKILYNDNYQFVNLENLRPGNHETSWYLNGIRILDETRFSVLGVGIDEHRETGVDALYQKVSEPMISAASSKPVKKDKKFPKLFDRTDFERSDGYEKVFDQDYSTAFTDFVDRDGDGKISRPDELVGAGNEFFVSDLENLNLLTRVYNHNKHALGLTLYKQNNEKWDLIFYRSKKIEGNSFFSGVELPAKLLREQGITGNLRAEFSIEGENEHFYYDFKVH